LFLVFKWFQLFIIPLSVSLEYTLYSQCIEHSLYPSASCGAIVILPYPGTLLITLKGEASSVSCVRNPESWEWGTWPRELRRQWRRHKYQRHVMWRRGGSGCGCEWRWRWECGCGCGWWQVVAHNVFGRKLTHRVRCGCGPKIWERS